MNSDKKKLKYSLVVPVFFTVIIWFIKIAEESANVSFAYLGIYPKETSGLIGIITSPFIHGDYDHLISNTPPFFLLSLALFYFYRRFSYRVFLIIWLFTGLGVWLTGGSAYHIGASGIIYGLAGFVFFAGLFGGKKNLAALSLLVVFLYGSMIWGVLPTNERISWESHLFGAITGILAALYFANRISSEKDDDDFDNSEDESRYSDTSISNENFNEIEYHFKEDE